MTLSLRTIIVTIGTAIGLASVTAMAASTYIYEWDVAEWDTETEARQYAPRLDEDALTKRVCAGAGRAKIHSEDTECRSRVWNNKNLYKGRRSYAYICETRQ
jgi:hypothetical protein